MTHKGRTDQTVSRSHQGGGHSRTGVLLLAATAMVTLSACSTTDLTGHPVNLISAVTPRAGIGYALPATVFDVTITRKLVACEGAVQDPKDPSKNKPGLVKFGTDATVVAQQIAGDQFRLDYQALGSSLKTSTLKLETYANGTLKSVNAEVTDHGPEVAASVLKSVAGVARIAMGLPGGGAVVGARTPPEPRQCSADATKALAAVAAAKIAVKQQTAALEVTTETIKTYNARRAIGTLAQADFAKLNAAMALSANQEAGLAEANTALGKTLAAITVVESFSWPDGAGKTEAVIRPSNNVVAKLKPFVTGEFNPNDMLSVIIALRPASGQSAGMPGEPSPVPPLPANGGIYYRMPGNGRIQICAAEVRFSDADIAATNRENELVSKIPKPADEVILAESTKARVEAEAAAEAIALANCNSANRGDLLVDQLLAIPQFGQLYVMPLHNGWGQDNVLTGSWRADGSPEAISYQEKKATAVAMAGLVESAVTAAVGIDKDVRGRNRADDAAALADKATAEKAELDILTHQSDLLKKQKELAEARASLNRSAEGEPGAAEVAAIDAETALINANKARLQAQLDYKALQAKASTP